MSVMAFHEKAGRSQVSSFFWDKGFSPAESATVAMLPFALSRERLVRSGAVWAFSVQPVLPSDWRPVVLALRESRTWARPLTQSPELGFGFYRFSSWSVFFTQLRPRLPGCCCATVRTLLRSPKGDAATPPAFWRWPRWLASCRSFRRAQPVSGPNA